MSTTHSGGEMEREEVKGKIEQFKQESKQKIEAKPIPAFFLGIAIGFLMGTFKQLFMPLLVLILIAGAVLFFWLNDKGGAKAPAAASESEEQDKASNE